MKFSGLILVFVERTCQKVGFLTFHLKYETDDDICKIIICWKWIDTLLDGVFLYFSAALLKCGEL